MAKARIEHVFNCSVEDYIPKIFLDEPFNRKLFVDELGFESWSQASYDETDTHVVRVVDAVPTMKDLPGPLKKLAEGGVGYRETTRFDKKTGVVTINVEPQQLKGKLTITGEMRCEPAGEGKCKRIYETSVEAKVFGIGGLIEKRIVSDIQENYDKAAVYTNRYIAENGI